MKSSTKLATTLAVISSLAAFTANAGDSNSVMTKALVELVAYQAQEAKVEERLKTLDLLDFEVFSGQLWDRLHESHEGIRGRVFDFEFSSRRHISNDSKSKT